jgi:SAM-dependent methyltransferase
VSRDFSNVYEDEVRADSYAALEFPGSYWLAFRDLPALIAAHTRGKRALDFGCGTGRSTRFLRGLGFSVIGVDISRSMLRKAREKDPDGDYVLVPEGELPGIGTGAFDLVFSTFTFDNIPTRESKLASLIILRDALAPDGRMVNVVSSPAIYVHEWASFSTRDFPENRTATSGDTVRIVMLDVDDRRPVKDVLCTDEDYADLYGQAGLEPITIHSPLGRADESIAWVSETEVSPWVIYVLARSVRSTDR